MFYVCFLYVPSVYNHVHFVKNFVISSLLQAFKVIKMSKVFYLLGLLKIVKCHNSCTLCYLLISSLIVPKSFVNYLVYCLKLVESFQSASLLFVGFNLSLMDCI